ncbi:NTF2 fold immunity protein, partial [Prevotella jejuni]|uniref:NTF2 fold immunity protein n=1 Tax=Prevotella jejuni TaxID=1177574 RepID=UPI003211B29F
MIRQLAQQIKQINVRSIDDFKKIQNEVKTIQEDTVLSYIKITDDRIPHNAAFLPKGNIISTEETAAQFGYLIAKALYGKEIYRQMPLNIYEKKDVWDITGSVNSLQGGGFYMEVSKVNGAILKLGHYK